MFYLSTALGYDVHGARDSICSGKLFAVHFGDVYDLYKMLHGRKQLLYPVSSPYLVLADFQKQI